VHLARLTTAEKLGQFALGLAVAAPVIMFTNLRLRLVQATDARREYAFGDYLGLRVAMTLLGLLVICVIAALASFPMATVLVIVVVGLARSFEAVSDIFYGLLQQRERMARIGISMMVKGPLAFAALGLAVYLTQSIVWGAVGLAVVFGGTLIFYDRRAHLVLARYASQQETSAPSAAESPGICRPDLRMMGALAWLALPLGGVSMLDTLNINLPRYGVQHYLGSSALGYYSAIGALMLGGSLQVLMALGDVVSPKLAQYYIEDLKAYVGLSAKLVLAHIVFGAAGVVVAVLYGRPILAIVYGPDYAAHSHVLVWVMVAAALYFLAGSLSCAVTAARFFKIQLPIGVAVVIANAGACFWLITIHGLAGAAMALCIGTAVRAAGFGATAVYVVWVRHSARGGLT